MKKSRLMLASAILLALSACGNPLSDPMADANAAFEKQDYLAARNNAQAALRENDKDAEALELLVRAQIAVGDGEDALATLERLKAVGALPADAALLEAEGTLQIGDAFGARALLDGEGSADAWRIRALSFSLENNEAAMLDAFKQGRAAEGDKLRLYTAEASNFLALGDAERAREPVTMAQQAGPDRIEAMYVTAKLAQLDGDSELATRAFMGVLQIAPFDRPSLLGAIAEMGNIDRVDLLRPLVARGRDAYPGDNEFAFLAARLMAQDGDWEGARDLLQKREAQLAAHPESRGLYAEALLELGQVELARTYIAPLYSQMPDNPQVARVYARMLLASGEFAEANRVIAPQAAGPNATAEDRELAARASRG